MATKSFTRTIVINNSDAINKLQNSKNNKVDEIINRNKDILSKKTSNITINNIIKKF